ncbi:hypothetical protein D3C84_1068500 [compost metagenome]
MGRVLQQCRQFLAPQVADAQQQQIGHTVQTVERVDMSIAHQASAYLQARHALTDTLQIA